MDDPLKKFEGFFKDEDLALIVDALCRRYKKLPHEFLQETTIFEFSFDVAIFCLAVDYEKKIRDNAKQGKKPVDWSSLGISRTVVKELKKEENK